jgi:proteasome component ECM29
MDVAASQRCLIQSLASHLEEIQKAFLALLADPKGKHFARESSCLGLVACRGLVNEQYNLNLRSGFSVDELNHKLLRAFGQTTNFGGSAMMETQAQAAARRAAQGMGDNEAPEAVITEVGGASGIGEAALGAYREMAAVSVSLEKYDIIYALFFLSLSHSFWLSPEAKRRYR